MKNSYEKAASSFVPDHMFDWAVNENAQDGCDVARVVIEENVVRNRAVEQRNKKEAEVEKRLTGFAELTTNVLGEAGFNVEYDITESNDVVLTYDDVDGDSTKKRRLLGRKIIERLTESAHGDIIDVKFPLHVAGGRIAVKLISEAWTFPDDPDDMRLKSMSTASGDSGQGADDEEDDDFNYPQPLAEEHKRDYDARYEFDANPNIRWNQMLDSVIDEITRPWLNEYDESKTLMSRGSWRIRVDEAQNDLYEQFFDAIDAAYARVHRGQQ